MSRAKRPAGSVAFVGAGPGDPGALTVRAAELIRGADVIVADAAVPAPITELRRDDAELIVGASDAPRAVAQAVRAGSTVVRLITGDPMTRAADEVDAAVRAKLAFEVVPGLAPALAIPAYAGIPVLGRRSGADVRIVDLAAVRPDLGGADSGTLVLLDPGEHLSGAVAALRDAGRPGTTPISVTADGSTTAQRTVVATLETIVGDVAAHGLTGELVAVVGEAVTQRERLSWFETKAMFGWQVLVPRTKEQAGALSERLREHGAVPVEVPTIAVEPPRTPAQMDRAVKGLVAGRYQWVVFTSTNAVRAVREKFEEIGLDCRAFAGIKVAAIGASTAEAIETWGIRPELVPSGEQSSDGLLADFPPFDEVFDPINRVLLPRADIATETLVAGLTDLDWEVEDVTAYRTVRAAPPAAEIREAIKGGGFDAVLFTSSSTVRNLVGIAGKPHASTIVAVIGPQTAKTAEELGLRVDVLAPTPSVLALTEALAAFALDRRAAGAPSRPAARAPKPPKAVKRAR